MYDDGSLRSFPRRRRRWPTTHVLIWIANTPWSTDVRQGRSFAIEMPLDQATLRFEWHLGALSERRTKLTHRVILAGQNMETYRK
jgi:hypothetical protein